MPTTPCEACGARAIMALYARNPGTTLPDAQRGDNPFYPIAQADIVLNLCVECFHETASQLRSNSYVGIRGTGVLPNKPAPTFTSEKVNP